MLGLIEAYRDQGDRPFDDDELELLADVGRSVAGALRRRSIVAGEGASEATPTGVLILDPNLKVVTWTAAARSWIDALPAAGLFSAWGILPPVAYPVATLSRSPATASDAHALERTVDGRWLMIEASPLDGDDADQVVLTLRGATPAETYDHLCLAYAFTRRERDVVAALILGLDTRAVSERLSISRHTVQDHLKAVFDKTGAHSRRELLATLNAAA